MKKIISAIVVLSMSILVLSGCGTGDVGDDTYMQNKDNAQSQAQQDAQSDYLANEPAKEAGFDNLCNYFEYNNYVVADQHQEVSYQMIGATNGIRYMAKCGSSSFIIELYEFDPNNLNEQAQTVIDETRNTGSFIMLGRNVPASVSDNNKYLMVYTDTSTEQANLDHKTDLENIIKTWP